MIKKLFNWIIPKCPIVFLKLDPIPVVGKQIINGLTMTKHAADRKLERNIKQRDIELAIEYGKQNEKGYRLAFDNLPLNIFEGMTLAERKYYASVLPLQVIVKEGTAIATIYTDKQIKKKHKKIKPYKERDL